MQRPTAVLDLDQEVRIYQFHQTSLPAMERKKISHNVQILILVPVHIARMQVSFAVKQSHKILVMHK